MTRAGALERRPSSIAQSLSVSRAVSTTRMDRQSSPKAARPGACRRPCSAVNAVPVHQSTSGIASARCGRAASLREASWSEKARAAGQSRAVVGLTSCKAAGANPCAGSWLSRLASPSCHARGRAGRQEMEGWGGTAARETAVPCPSISFEAAIVSGPGATSRDTLPARCSSARMRDRNPSSTTCRLPEAMERGVAGRLAGSGMEGRPSMPPVRNATRDATLELGHARHVASAGTRASATRSAIMGEGGVTRDGGFGTGDLEFVLYMFLARRPVSVNTEREQKWN